MKKTNKINFLLTLILCLILLFTALLCTHNYNRVFASTSTSMHFDFSNDQTLSQFTVKKSDATSTVALEEEKLIVDNQSGITELRLPDIDYSDFVIAFTMRRISGETRIMDGNVKVYPHPYLGVKYRMSEDFQVGYETRVHYAQVLTQGLSSHNDFDKTTGTPIENSGIGLENWQVASADIENNVFNGRNTTFNYYRKDLELNKDYDVRLEVTGNIIKLFVNDVFFMKDILDNNTQNVNLAINVMQKAKIAISNLSVYTIYDYAQEKVSKLNVQQNQASDVVDEYVSMAKDIEEYFGRAFTGAELDGLSAWSAYLTQKELLNSYYNVEQKYLPTINVVWRNSNDYATGDVITLPVATAEDCFGNSIVTNLSVKFDGKNLRVENNSFTAREVGEYTVIYSATSSYGERQTKEFTISVAQGGPSNIGNSNTILIIGIVAISISAIAFGTVLFIFLKKRGNNNEENK